MRATQKLAAAAGALLALLMADRGWAQAADGGLSWDQALDRVYPAAAKAAGVAGTAWVHCRIRKDATFDKCSIAGEIPKGQGFGEAALALTPLIVAPPERSNTFIVLPVHFGEEAARPSREPAFRPAQRKYGKLGPVGPYWPDDALRTGLHGRAVVDCKVESDGKLTGCAVARGTTHPMFWESAARMAQDGWMTAAPAPVGVEAPADGIWRFRIDYPARTHKDTGGW